MTTPLFFWTYDRADGMILYNGQTSSGNGDFVSINLVNGRVQYRYDLGSGLANLTAGGEANLVLGDPAKYPIALNEWHSVKVTRNGPHGSLQVDDGPVVTGGSAAPLNELNLETPLYLGGFK